MNKRKFKIGDKVRIINTSMIEPSELNKIGVIIKIENDEWNNYATYTVDMGRPRRYEEPDDTCWYLNENMIKLVNKPNKQLLFSFMNK